MSLVMQRGSGALIAVMIVLLMGTLMLHATRRQLSDAMSLVGDERRYIQQFTGAMSALAWGSVCAGPLRKSGSVSIRLSITGVPVWRPRYYCSVLIAVRARWRSGAGSVRATMGRFTPSPTAGWIFAR